MTIEKEIEVFNDYTKQLVETFAKKRNDYGQTTTETFKKFGPISLLVRMHDKLGRLDNLFTSGKYPHYECVEDTLIDLANYSLIMLIELQKEKLEKAEVANNGFEGYLMKK